MTILWIHHLISTSLDKDHPKFIILQDEQKV